jgi:hypothetical protein
MDGLSLAEEPHTGESFGAHRCRVLAESAWLIRSHDAGETPESITAAHLQRSGIDPARPHARPGSIEIDTHGWEAPRAAS